MQEGQGDPINDTTGTPGEGVVLALIRKAKELLAGDTIHDASEGWFKIIGVSRYGGLVGVKGLDRLGSLVNVGYPVNRDVVVKDEPLAVAGEEGDRG